MPVIVQFFSLVGLLISLVCKFMPVVVTFISLVLQFLLVVHLLLLPGGGFSRPLVFLCRPVANLCRSLVNLSRVLADLWRSFATCAWRPGGSTARFSIAFLFIAQRPVRFLRGWTVNWLGRRPRFIRANLRKAIPGFFAPHLNGYQSSSPHHPNNRRMIYLVSESCDKPLFKIGTFYIVPQASLHSIRYNATCTLQNKQLDV